MKRKIYLAIRKKIIKNLFPDIQMKVNYVNDSEALIGRHAVVFGGSSGIGKNIAIKLYSSGCKVMLVGRNEEKLNNICTEYKDIQYIKWDICDFEKIEELILNVNDRMGGIDIIINSAGILTENDLKADFFNVKISDWDQVMNTNLKAVYFLCQKFAQDMIKNKRKGNILNIASTEGMHGAKVPYGLSKWGIVGLTEGLGKLLAPMGIVVNGIAPGATATQMMNEKENSLVLSTLPGGRYSLPEEIANLAVFMVSDMGKNMIGEMVRCDAGENLR